MATNSTFRFAFSGRVVVYVGGNQVPDDNGWAEYVAGVRTHVQRHPDLVWLVWSGSARPSSAQRKALLDIIPKDSRAAVIIESTVARGVVTAFSWFMAAIKPFSPDNIDAAYTHLGLTPEERTQVTQETARWRAELEGIRKSG